MSVLSRLTQVLSVLLLVLATQAWAAIDVYQFKTPEEEARFQSLISELRCPKCQNQNLAGSDAGIAHDLKTRTYQLMKEGKSDNEIRQYMIDRYGEFITYKPAVKSSTWLLWFGPFVLLVLVAVILIWRHRQQPTVTAPLNPEEQARLAALLKRTD